MNTMTVLGTDSILYFMRSCVDEGIITQEQYDEAKRRSRLLPESVRKDTVYLS